ncbi:MAG: epimerase [Planctomycetes bacterium GWF2_41_51]|nr:MAG: epimerase [Planctomycetes bacterium GWF2_41_51]HBG28789.1 epimerase [Phycisphaerales bacterium]
MNRKVLVTGAAGFIGSHLCERLVAEGDILTGLDNFDIFYDRKTKESNIKSLLKSDKFELVEGDIRNADCVRSVCKSGIDVIVHLAAKAGVRPSIEDPCGYADVNINGTLVMLEAAKKFNIKKFIFASSSSVYGNNKKVPFSETDNVDNPISPYAATKKAGELICYTYHKLYNFDINCLRFFTVYGPRQRPDLAIHKFAKLIDSGKPIPMYGDGSMMRDFTFIDDIVDGIIAAIDRCKGYEIFNLGESQPVRLVDLIKEIEKAFGKKAVVERLPLQPGDVEKTFADVSKAGRMLEYNPRTEITTGLKIFADWFKQQHLHTY